MYRKIKNNLRKTITLILILNSVFLIAQKNSDIWFAQPAKEWMQALPVGNGRLGAMVFGGTKNERIQLNEDSMWPGSDDWGDSKGNKNDLELIRNLIQKGEVHKADKLVVEKFSYKAVKRSHQTLGDLYIDFENLGDIDNYTRSLSLDDAVVTVKYTSGGDSYSEKVFSSAIDDVLVVELSTTAKKGMNFTVNIDRPDDTGHKTVTVSNPSEREISMSGMVTQYGGQKFSKPFPIEYGVEFEARVRVKIQSGSIKSQNGKLIVKGVKKATIFLAANTSFYSKDYKSKNTNTLNSLKDKSFDELLKRHIEDYQKLYKRVSFDLGGYANNKIPIDRRLEKVKKGVDDPDLIAKLFQYGRYLLISCSRPGTNPANLQGLWNKHIKAPWNADYHLNINLEMNYWLAEVTNLGELHQAFFDFMEKVRKRGENTAKEQYGISRGAVIHHATDMWATPWMRSAQAYWGYWIHGGGWTAQHFWQHFQFTRDTAFLREKAYPYLKSIAEFYLDWLVWDEKTQTWVSTPETSPENSYIAQDGKPAALSYGSAMGHQIIREVFDNVLESARILNYDGDFVKEVKLKRKKLHRGVVIGEDGRILEWNEPYEEHEKGHRHMSHLYALHPGNQITIDKTPKAFEAAKKTIAYRLKYGGAGTGWSRAWMINLNARLFEKREAEENIKKFLQISLADNLFDMHPPFQIDGNFGFIAAVAELLLQSHEGFLRILPTLPHNWKTGKITGLKARGNILVGIEWTDGILDELTLMSNSNQSKKIVYNDKVVFLDMKKGKNYILDKNLNIIKK